MPWRVDSQTCIGCSVCTDTAPGVFWLDENAGFARVKDASSPSHQRDCQDAERDCPVGAISFGDPSASEEDQADGSNPLPGFPNESTAPPDQGGS